MLLRGGSFWLIEHARGIAQIVGLWLGLSIIGTAFHHVTKRVYMRKYVGNLLVVWGDYMPEIPEVHDFEAAVLDPVTGTLPPATAVGCPVCNAKPLAPCTTTAGNVAMMQVTHVSRAKRYDARLRRYRSPT
jgi:hypothetical protein